MVDRRTTLLRLGLVWTAQHPHVTPATRLSARICIRPVLSPFLYFHYAGLTYPILLDSRISLVSFLVSLDYGSYDPRMPPSATRQRHHTEILLTWMAQIPCTGSHHT